MNPRFCRNCGAENATGNAFCQQCGSPMSEPAATQPNSVPYAPPAQPAAQQPYAAPVYAPPQYQQPPYQPASYPTQTGYGTRPVSSAKATGLIVGVFALVVAAILLVGIFLLPSKEDYSVLGLNADTNTTETDTKTTEAAAGETTAPQFNQAYGKIPDDVISRVNPTASLETYQGNYTGTVTFNSENMDLLGQLSGDTEEAEFLKSLDGTTIDCTATLGEGLDVYSDQMPTEIVGSDGNMFNLYHLQIENGISVDEYTETIDEIGLTFTQLESAHFLDDGSLYVISSMTGQTLDGMFFASELRITLRPAS